MDKWSKKMFLVSEIHTHLITKSDDILSEPCQKEFKRKKTIFILKDVSFSIN